MPTTGPGTPRGIVALAASVPGTPCGIVALAASVPGTPCGIVALAASVPGARPVSAAQIVCRNPADAREVVASYAAADAQDVAAACARAHAAQPGWAALPGPARGEVLHGAAALLEGRVDAVARRIVAEEGKLLADARGEVARAVAVLRFHAGEAERGGGQLADAAQAQTLAFTRRRALGVVGLITPWNFPIAIPAWKLAPALAAGNAVVIKPASAAPAAVLELVGVLHEAGVPVDVAQVVLGGARVGLALADDPHLRALSFTGSTEVGRMLAARVARRAGEGGREVRFQGELGGNNPLVVLADADPEFAVGLACEGAFAAAGQKCTATRRLIVERPLYKVVLDELVRRAHTLVLGEGLDPNAQVPPLIDAGAVQEVLEAVEQAGALGAELRAGGTRPDGALRHGSFLEPTVLAGVAPGMRVLDEEVFGPVCAVQSAADLQEAIALANATRYGLSASVCTNDLARALRFVEGSEAGMVHVNRPTPGADPHMPFGGLKGSAAGGWREQGSEAARFYSEQQTVYVHHDEGLSRACDGVPKRQAADPPAHERPDAHTRARNGARRQHPTDPPAHGDPAAHTRARDGVPKQMSAHAPAHAAADPSAHAPDDGAEQAR